MWSVFRDAFQISDSMLDLDQIIAIFKSEMSRGISQINPKAMTKPTKDKAGQMRRCRHLLINLVLKRMNSLISC